MVRPVTIALILIELMYNTAHTSLLPYFAWHVLPDATCQSEHRPLQEQLQVCTERDSTDVYFSYCCSLNHSYIYRQLMQQ